jgi:hypothetical protein
LALNGPINKKHIIMKITEQELESRIDQCVKFLNRALDRNNLNNESEKFVDDFQSLGSVIMQMSMYLAEFNFYPSEFHSHCCQVSFFTSLSGQRWNLKQDERLSFDQMYKHLIRHCQGSCSGKTTFAVLIVDNWDDDIAKFWEPNIIQLKQKGVTI